MGLVEFRAIGGCSHGGIQRSKADETIRLVPARLNLTFHQTMYK